MCFISLDKGLLYPEAKLSRLAYYFPPCKSGLQMALPFK